VRHDQHESDVSLASTIDDNVQARSTSSDSSSEYSELSHLSNSAKKLARARAELRGKQRVRELFQLRHTLEDHFARQDASFVHIANALDRMETQNSRSGSSTDGRVGFEASSSASASSTQHSTLNSDTASVDNKDGASSVPDRGTLFRLQQGQALHAVDGKEQLLVATNQYVAEIERLKYDNAALLSKIEAAEAARELAGIAAKRLAEQYRAGIDHLQRTVERLSKDIELREAEREEAIATVQRLEILNAEYQQQIERLEFECNIIEPGHANQITSTAPVQCKQEVPQTAAADHHDSLTSTFSILRLYEPEEDSSRHSHIDEGSSIPPSQSDTELAQPTILSVEVRSSSPSAGSTLAGVSPYAAADPTENTLPDSATLPKALGVFSTSCHEQAPVRGGLEKDLVFPAAPSSAIPPTAPVSSAARSTGHVQKDHVGSSFTSISDVTRPTVPRTSIFTSTGASRSTRSDTTSKPSSTASPNRLSLRDRQNARKPSQSSEDRSLLSHASVRAGAELPNGTDAGAGRVDRPLGDKTNSSSASSRDSGESAVKKTSDKGKARIGFATKADRAPTKTAASIRQVHRAQSVPARAVAKISTGPSTTTPGLMPSSSINPVNHRRAGAITSLPLRRPSAHINKENARDSASATVTKTALRSTAARVASNVISPMATTSPASVTDLTALNLGDFVAVVMPDATATASGRAAVRRRAVVFHTNPTPKPRPTRWD